MLQEDGTRQGAGEPSRHLVAPPMHDSQWWRGAVIYQVYVRSFADGNCDGTGDLAGVRSRLPYLRELGVDAIWFTPWYVSPLTDGGYDVADYRRIDPQFGTLEEAEALIAEALELGIRTIVDVVPNHISDQHAWFQEALAAGPGSPQRERFWFHPGKGPGGTEAPTQWVSDFQGSTWTRTTDPDGTPGEWYLHLFAPQQPDVNWSHPDVRAEFEDVLRFWFDRGVGGIRIDSAALLIKDATLPEVPTAPEAGEHPHVDRDEIHDVYRSWRKVADSYPGTRVLVGEVWLADQTRFAKYLRPDEMHTAFNFDFMARPWDARELRAVHRHDARRPPTRRCPRHLGAVQPRRHAAGHPLRARGQLVRLQRQAVRYPHGSRARTAPGPRCRPAHRRAARVALHLPGRRARVFPRSRTSRST